MNSESHPERSGGPRSVRSEQIVDALHGVVGDIESFLSQWLSKVQDELATMEKGDLNVALKRRFEALQEEKKRWEAKRQRELEEIEQKASHLTQAWLKLETEQRQLLRMQERRGGRREVAAQPAQQATQASATQSAANQQPAASRRPSAAHTESCPAPPEAPASAPAPRSANGIGASQRRSGGAIQSISDAVRQFEQLRREIEFTRAST